MNITLPGVPEGWELVRWDFPKEGESFVRGSGAIFTADFDFDTVQHLVVRKVCEPPEDLKLKPGITLPGVPEGWELVRHGVPKKGESFVDTGGIVDVADRDWAGGHRLIVRKVYEPPEWLGKGWIFKHSILGWFHRVNRPFEETGNGEYRIDVHCSRLTGHTNFVGPDVSPEDSLIEIVGDQ